MSDSSEPIMLPTSEARIKKSQAPSMSRKCLNDLFALIFVWTCQLGDGTKSVPGNNIILVIVAVVVGSELSDDGQRRLARYCIVVSQPKRRSQQKKSKLDI